MWNLYYLMPVVVLVHIAPLPQISAAEVKYAPNYCLRFRFNCERPEKKAHVCCLHPLPPSDGEAQGTGESAAAEAGSGMAMKFRPIKLPVTKKDSSNDDDNNNDNSGGATHKTPSHQSIINKGRPKNNLNLGKPPSQSRTTTKAPRANVRPRICERLVINCKNSPEHRCCQYENAQSDAAGEETTDLPPRDEIPVDANRVKVKEVPTVVKGEAIPVPIDIVNDTQKKFADIINDEVTIGVPTDEPYNRIPTECFTQTFDCVKDPTNPCCMYLEK